MADVRTRLNLCVVALAGLGCAPTVADRVPVAVAIPVTGGGPVANDGDAEVGPRCVLETPSWDSGQVRGALRFRQGGPPFLHFTRGRVTLRFGVAHAGVRVEVRLGGVTVEGLTGHDEVALYATKPLVFEDMALPLPTTGFEWTGRNQDARLLVTYGLMLHDGTRRELRLAAECDEVALDPADFDAELFARGSYPVEDAFIIGSEVAVSPAVGDVAPARLRVGDGGEQVSVIERQGEHVRVVWRRQWEVIRGWVSATQIAAAPTPTDDVAEDFGVGGLGLWGVGGASYWTCPHELVLFAKQGDALHRIGRVAANVKITLGVVNDGFRDVSLDISHHGLEAADGVTILVNNDTLGDCTT